MSALLLAISYFYPPGIAGGCLWCYQIQKERSAKTDRSVLALPIFPGRCQPSIVGRNELNYRVRNGNGWTLVLISTNYVIRFPEEQTHYKVFIALCQERSGDPYRIRTDVKGVRGLCLNHLTNGPHRRFGLCADVPLFKVYPLRIHLE